MLFSKLYAKALKNIIVFFINIIEYSKIKYTPAQLETHVTACRYIFNNVLVKNYNAENLISSRDLVRYKHSGYEEFPECFYLDDWKITFFYNDTIQRVIREHLQVQTGESKRLNYALHQVETQSSNERAKDDILRRMSRETIEEVLTVQSEEYDRRNKVALGNEVYQREQAKAWKRVLKGQLETMWRGVPTRQRLSWHRLADGTRPVMEECFGPSRFQFFEGQYALEGKIFSKSEAEEVDLLLLE